MKYLKAFIFPLCFLLLSAGALKISYDGTLVAHPDVPLTTELKKIAVKNQEKTKEGPPAEVTNVQMADLAKAKSQYAKTLHQELTGQLTAPTVNLSLPILYQANDLTLSTGAAQYFTNRKMGTGNYILVSHNFYGAPVLMDAIKDLKIGAEVTVTDFSTVYTYQVTRNEVIPETQVEVLAETTTPTLTLLRCEGGEDTFYRRLVVATFVKKETPQKPIQTVQAVDGTTPPVVKSEGKQTSSYVRFLQKLSSQAWFSPVRIQIGKIFNTEKNIMTAFFSWLVVFSLLTVMSFYLAFKSKHKRKVN